MTKRVKCRDTDSIDFVIASPKHFSCTEAAKGQPESPDPPAHDAFTRLLIRLEPDPGALWAEARPLVHRKGGLLVLDESTLDKPYATKMDLVTRHCSGKHHAVVRGINLITLPWTDGDRQISRDYRLYDKSKDGLTKNDHFAAMLGAAKERGFEPGCVAFDGWYGGLDNLKSIRSLGWHWLTRLKVSRRVNLDRQGDKAVGETAIDAGGTVVHLEGYGLIRVFRVVSRDGDTEHWATGDLAMDEVTRLGLAERTWAIENYHRGLKQCCGMERHQARAGRAQRDATTSGWRSGRS